MAAGTIGKYERLDVLGHGTSGVVYLAWDTLLRRQVALKEIRADGPETERMLEEARVLDRLRHPNIVRIHSVDVASGVILLDMELVRGRNLAALLKERAGNPVPEAEAVRIALAVLAALGYAHERRIIHRDIKPANILLGDDGAVKLTDFGLAEALGTGSVAGGGGTYPYMAPEDFAEDASSDRRTDIWAVGVVLYEMLTGRRPFMVQRVKDPFAWKRVVEQEEPQPPSEANLALSDKWNSVIARALEKEKSARYATAEEFAKAVQAVASPAEAPNTVIAQAVPEQPEGSFVFSSTGEIVYTLDDLLRVAARNWDESRRALSEGRVEGFLRGIGEIYVADLAGEMRERGHRGESQDRLLKEFLERAQGEEPIVFGRSASPSKINEGGEETRTVAAPFWRRSVPVSVPDMPTVAAPVRTPIAVAEPEPESPKKEKKETGKQDKEQNQEAVKSGVRWWFWPMLALCVSPVAAGLVGLQEAVPVSEPMRMFVTLSSWTITGFLSVMLLLVSLGARMSGVTRFLALVPVAVGMLAAGGLVNRAPSLLPRHELNPGDMLVLLAIPVALLIIQAATARMLWRIWLTVLIAIAGVTIGIFAALPNFR